MTEIDVRSLRDFRGPIGPGDRADAQGIQTAVTVRPELTVEPLDSDDVIRAVAHAAVQGMPVSVTNTGHGATSLSGGLLIRTHRMSQIRIDSRTRTAEVGPGATWGQVTAAAARHGLAPLSGTAGTVGPVGYTLGGGISPLSRAFGYAADHVVDLDDVTPDGSLRYVGADHEPDLFWAARGAGTHLGIITRIRFRLFPIDHVYAAALPCAIDDWAEAADRFATWSADIPEDMGAFLSLKSFPDLPSLPEVIRGRRTAAIYVTSLGIESDVAEQVEALGELIDRSAGIAPTPAADLAAVFNEPTGPHAFQGDAMAASGIDAEPLVTSLAPLVGADIDRPQFLFVHRLGGAMSTAPDGGNAIGNRTAQYLVRIVTSPDTSDDPAAIATEQDHIVRSLSTEPTGRVLNFLFGDNLDVARNRDCYAPDDLRRLADITARVDPEKLLMPARGRLD